jgi:hypothetical protein
MRVPYPKTFASALKETYLTSKQKYPLNGKARIEMPEFRTVLVIDHKLMLRILLKEKGKIKLKKNN